MTFVKCAMRLGTLRTLLLFWIFSLYHADGRWAWYQLQNVPISRVFANLQQRLAKDTNDFEATYYLARVHSMAYATNLLTVDVRTNDNLPQFYFVGGDSGVPKSVQVFRTPEARQVALAHLTNAIALHQRALDLLRTSTNVSSKAWMILPTQLGLAWCLDQAGRTNEAIVMYHRTLEVAWDMEVTGDFDLKNWVNNVWTGVQSRPNSNPIPGHSVGHIGPGVCYSEEVIGYLLKLLDPVRDADEVAKLRWDQNILASSGPRAVTPILIPVVPSAGLNELVDEHASVAFDLDGSGLKRNWAWPTPKAGWLVFDPQRTGRIDSGLQMFGNVTFWIFWPDGYEALSSLDDNGDGVLSGSELRGLAVWNDRNGNGVSDPGEVIPVEALGIKSISCSSQTDPAGMHWNPQGVTFTDGSVRPTFDWIVPASKPAPVP